MLKSYGGGGGSASNPPVPTSTFALLPAASANTGNIYLVTDIGPAGVGSFWESNGTIWKPVGGIVNLLTVSKQANTNGGTGNTTLASLTIPAGIMATSGLLDIGLAWHGTVAATRNLQMIVTFGGTNTYLNAVSVTTTINGMARFQIANNNSASAQTFGGIYGNNAAGANTINGTTSINTANATTLNFLGNTTNAADFVFLDNATVNLLMP